MLYIQPMVLVSGNSSSHPASFILLGIPGLESFQFWIAFPCCATYAVAVVGNITLLRVIRIDHTLHKPMYLFLAMLAITDLIEYHACLIQVFFIHAFSFMESGVLMAMALDRYVAICFPLRHSSLMTPSVMIELGTVVMLRGLLWVSLFCFMVSRMPFCHHQAIPQSYCEHMAVLKLVCADTSINRGYGLFVAFSVAGFDMTVIGMSYMMILRAVLQLPSGEARLKAFSTCASHICVILAFYIPFSFFSYCFYYHTLTVIPISLSILYSLVPSMFNTCGVKTKHIQENAVQSFVGKFPAVEAPT
uniref:Olfactory receptor family 52 subfamily R member 1 (gene/pseudogene) n=1 Tax=Theropithecus gelada TaxID=9565 RepID=A0A8D2G2X8_THEGE